MSRNNVIFLNLTNRIEKNREKSTGTGFLKTWSMLHIDKNNTVDTEIGRSEMIVSS